MSSWMVELHVLGDAEMPDGSPRNGAKTNSHAPSLPYHAPQMIQDMAMICGMIWQWYGAWYTSFTQLLPFLSLFFPLWKGRFTVRLGHTYYGQAVPPYRLWCVYAEGVDLAKLSPQQRSLWGMPRSCSLQLESRVARHIIREGCLKTS